MINERTSLRIMPLRFCLLAISISAVSICMVLMVAIPKKYHRKIEEIFTPILDCCAASEIADCSNATCNLSRKALRFVVLGDMGGMDDAPHYSRQQAGVAQYLNTLVQEKEIDFIVLLGDNFYSNGVRSVTDERFTSTFENVYGGANLQNTPFYIIAGNHDYYGNVQAQLDYAKLHPRWKYPDLYYTTRYEFAGGTTATFVFIDTIILCGPTTLGPTAWRNKPNYVDQPEPVTNAEAAAKHLIWLDDVLNNHSQSDFLFVIGHYPVYSVGDHGSIYCMQEKVEPLLQRYNVSVNFAGHDHNLQHLETTSSGTTIHYVVSGAAAWMKRSYKHAAELPAGVSKFYYPDDIREAADGSLGKGKGGFVYADIGNTNGTVQYVNKDGAVLHYFHVFPSKNRKQAM